MARTVANRTTLLNRKANRKFARKGVELLKAKRNALMAEHTKAMEKLSGMEKELFYLRRKAIQSLMITHAIDGSETVDLIASMLSSALELDVDIANTWGVRIARVSGISHGDLGEFNAGSISARTVAAQKEFRDFVECLIRYSFLRAECRRLYMEMEKTSRRMNSLVHIFIPRLSGEIRYIDLVLESRELEDIVRQKNIKKRKTAKNGLL